MAVNLLFLIFINNLPNDVKSVLELFIDDVKLFVWATTKEIIQADLNRLFY